MTENRDHAGTLEEIERFILRDPARRGLLSSEGGISKWMTGQLAPAGGSLARSSGGVGIVTGFYIPRGNPPAAETDGPPGACLLARVLEGLGRRVLIVTDERCAGAVRAAAEGAGLSGGVVRTIRDEEIDKFCRSPEVRGWGHLIAIERVGPSHTLESLTRQGGNSRERFVAEVPEGEQGHCFNMRGERIDEYTGGLHRLFEELPRVNPGLRTIGIGDGGNEIGMGRIPWEVLRGHLSPPSPSKILCGVATDWNIVAGTSNWGGFALACGVALIAGRVDLLAEWDAERQLALLERMVREGPAVDGVTRLQEATVDGLPFLTYVQAWEGMRRVLGLG